MRRQRTRTLLLTLVAALALPAASHAQESSMRGTWVINRQASDDVNRAIETAVARMSFITRPIARGRLRRTNPVYNRVVVNYTPQEVSTTFDARHAIVSPGNGHGIEWTREDGEKFTLSTQWQESRLVQTFRAEDGSRTNTYVVSPDGHTLTMNVVLRSPKLPQPLEYKLVYTKGS